MCFRQHAARSFPTGPIVDIPDNDPIFHTIYDLDDRYQVAGMPAFEEGHTYEKGRDRQGAALARASTTITAASWSPCATTWIWAIPGSTPTTRSIPRSFPTLGIRLGVNYVVYAMSH